LIIAAFGTNESSNKNFKPEAHKRMVVNLISRAKKASPSSECVIFGPVDRGGPDYSETIERLNEVQHQAATELGCAFWDGQKAMGGKLAMEDWFRAKPSLAASDRIHLSRNGYVRIGSMLARDMLRGYGVWSGRSVAEVDALSAGGPSVSAAR
jgi:lysophospholipase L1-like esterase